MPDSKHDAPRQQMQCMEVWGGSQLTEQSVEFGGLDTWVYSKPHGDAEHGGDVYYASSCATGRISRLLLADVAGHGQAVAETAAHLRTLMRRFVNRLDQAEFVRLLNQEFGALSQAGAFATAVVTTFFAPSRRLMICNAGHPRPLLYRAKDGSWSLLTHKSTGKAAAPQNLPLGMIDITEYEHFDVELESGDCVVTYTDALIESNDEDGEMLGETGVLRIVRDLGRVDIETLIPALLGEIGRRSPGNLTDDDVTVLAMRANGRELHFSIGEKLNAAARLAGSVIGAVRRHAEHPPMPDAHWANIGGAIIPALGRRWRAR
jgi:sigma-B regulation protein RsbU (phosphoserine phosphatase)